MAWLSAFVFTCLIEIPIVAACVRLLGWWPDGRGGLWRVLLVALALQATNPVIWVVGPRSLIGLVSAEAAVTLVEGLALGWWVRTRWHPDARWLPALLVAVVANGCSLLFGLVV